MKNNKKILTGLLIVGGLKKYLDFKEADEIKREKQLLETRLEKIQVYFDVLRYYFIMKMVEAIAKISEKILKSVREGYELGLGLDDIEDLVHAQDSSLQAKNNIIEANRNFQISKLKYDNLLKREFNLIRAINNIDVENNLLIYFDSISIDDKDLNYKFKLLKIKYETNTKSLVTIKSEIKSNEILLNEMNKKLELGLVTPRDTFYAEKLLYDHKLEFLNIEYDTVILKYQLLLILQYCNKYQYNDIIKSLKMDKEYYKSDFFKELLDENILVTS